MAIQPQNPNWSCQDQDNFIRNMVTQITGGAVIGESAGAFAWGRHSETPALMLDEIKTHLRIEPGIAVEDVYLMFLEAAARHFAENALRYPIDARANPAIKQAMLLLIAAWYRNREAISSEAIGEYELAFTALLSPERDFSVWY
jgi:hypothetical protein